MGITAQRVAAGSELSRTGAAAPPFAQLKPVRSPPFFPLASPPSSVATPTPNPTPTPTPFPPCSVSPRGAWAGIGIVGETVAGKSGRGGTCPAQRLLKLHGERGLELTRLGGGVGGIDDEKRGINNNCQKLKKKFQSKMN